MSSSFKISGNIKSKKKNKKTKKTWDFAFRKLHHILGILFRFAVSLFLLLVLMS